MIDHPLPQLEITLTFPVLPLPEAVQAEAIVKAREAFTMTLLKHGVITSGRAGYILGMSRLDVLELMGNNKISLFDDTMDAETLMQEVESTKALLDSQRK
jgi:Uncharacterised protein family (UPF0175)